MDEQKHTAIMDAGECLDHKTLLDYQAGLLNAAQNHLVEKHLLDCELCNEALEGLAGAEPAQVEEAVADLQNRAWQRVAEIEKRRRRGAWIWMSSSAAAVLLVAVLFFTRSSPTGNAEENMAFKKAFDPNPQPGMQATKADSVINGNIAMEYKSADKPLLQPGLYRSTAPVQGDQMEESNEGLVMESPSESPKPEKLAQKFFSEDINSLRTLETESSNFSNKDKSGNFFIDQFAFGDTKNLEEKRERKEQQEAKPDSRADATADNLTLRDEETGDVASDFDDATTLEGEKTVIADSVVVAAAPTVSGVGGINSGATFSLSHIDNSFLNSAGNQPAINYTWTIPITADGTAPANLETVTISDSRSNRKAIAQKAKTAAVPAFRQSAGFASTYPDNSPMKEALTLHQAQNFSEAEKKFRAIIEADPANQEARLYLGIDLLATSQPVPALTQFNEVIAKGDARQAEDAAWYKALAFVQLKDRIHAEPLLDKIVEEGGRYEANALMLLSQLQW